MFSITHRLIPFAVEKVYIAALCKNYYIVVFYQVTENILNMYKHSFIYIVIGVWYTFGNKPLHFEYGLTEWLLNHFSLSFSQGQRRQAPREIDYC